MHTCREPDYVAHGKKEVREVQEYDTLLGVEEPVKEVYVFGKDDTKNTKDGEQD